jgi:hypothetical protein
VWQLDRLCIVAQNDGEQFVDNRRQTKGRVDCVHRNKQHLTWKLVSYYVPSFGYDAARAQLHQSFNDWARHIPLNFHEVSEHDQADFDIAFIPTHHDPLARFDGAGGTLAYAYFPPSGMIRFEADEPWTEQSVERDELHPRHFASVMTAMVTTFVSLLRTKSVTHLDSIIRISCHRLCTNSISCFNRTKFYLMWCVRPLY